MSFRPTLSRRQFIQAIAAFSASWTLSGCHHQQYTKAETSQVYDNLSEPWLTLAATQEHLFPSDQDSPGAKDIMALRFLQNMLDAPDTYVEEKEFILNGVNWLNDLSNKQYQLTFIELNPEQKETLLRRIETSRAGSRWLSLMMTYIVEALLSDPVYGGNKDAVGWTWLEHIPGFPTPASDQVYFKLGAYAPRRRSTKA